MMKLRLVAFAALGALPLAGCGVQPGEMAGDGAGQASEALVWKIDGTGAELGSTAVADDRAAPSEVGPALDAQAAMAAGDGAGAGNGLLAGTTGPLGKWYTGLVAAGVQQHWYWNNSGSGVYEVGFAPSGGST